MSTATSATSPADLLRLLSPLVRSVRRRLRYEALRAVRGSTLPADGAAIEELLYPQLANQLFHLIGRTAVLELNVARLKGQLTGRSPQERFQQFVRQLGSPETAAAILREYPVLARQAVACAQQWFTSGLELVGRLAADWPLVCAKFFGGADPGPLVAVEGGAGDRHCGGRSVQILHFASGARLVYKPKPLAVEAAFGNLLGWLNARGAATEVAPLRPLDVLHRGTHGWVEFVRPETCQTPAEIERFYRRQGAYLALLHLLAATDVHFENLVAAGEHPVLIDLEALFHRRLPGSAGDPSSRTLIDSVMAVRLLPQVSHVEGCDDAIDFSGLGATPGRATPFRAATFAGMGTDEMRLAHETYRLPGAAHLPTLRGAAVRLADYELPLTDGFTAMYTLLGHHRGELLAEGGPLAAFTGAEVRFIARPTQVYAILLEQSTHPDRFRSEAARRDLFRRLEVRAAALPCLGRLLAAELADLDEHNIPIFTTRPESRDLWTSRGQRIAEFFDRSGLEVVRERLGGFGGADLARQCAYIRQSFASLV